jgi:hypothetical protein
MTAEIASIRTASEAAAALRSTASTDPAALDARTLTAVTEVLRAAAELSRAQRPIVLHGPEFFPPPAVMPDTAAYGAHVRIPAPPARDETRDETPPARRSCAWGERLMFFGCGVALAGVVGAMVATFAGVVWMPAVSAFGALLWPIGGAAIQRADRAERGR